MVLSWWWVVSRAPRFPADRLSLGEGEGVIGLEAGGVVDAAGGDAALPVAVQDEVADVVGEVTLAAVIDQMPGDRVGHHASEVARPSRDLAADGSGDR